MRSMDSTTAVSLAVLWSGLGPTESRDNLHTWPLIFDYARAAKRHLASGGLFVFCFPTPQKQRAIKAVAAAELGVERMRDVIPRAGLPALFSLFACRHLDDAAECVVDAPLVVRGEDGELSEAMQQVRRGFGFAG